MKRTLRSRTAAMLAAGAFLAIAPRFAAAQFQVEESTIKGLQLTADRKSYRAVTGSVKSRLPHPMPISLMVWRPPGSDPEIITVASAYQSATRHRVPPPAFGSLPREERISRR